MFRPQGKRQTVSVDFLGYVFEDQLDKFIESYLEEHIEEVMFRALARRGGIGLEYEFQTKLDALWYEENPDTEPKDWDMVRAYPNGPTYIRRKTIGYTRVSSTFTWFIADDEEEDDEEEDKKDDPQT